MFRSAIVPWRTSSEGANALATSLTIPLLTKDQVHLWGGKGKYLINWGCGDFPSPMPHTFVFNEPMSVQTCVDKRFFFRLPNTFPRPPHTEDYSVALNWLREGKTVLARCLVEGYDGAGLKVVEPAQYPDLPAARLFTEFMPSDSEWRVHIFHSKVIIQQQRVRRRDYIGPDSPIRVGSNGYGFNVEEVPQSVMEAGLECFDEFDLDFAALDILYNSRENKAYVLEINSAPELTPYCVEKYSQAFRRIIDGR